MTQEEALTILKTGANCFLTGGPGSGKTYTVNAYIAWLRSHGIEPARTASTGIAATHIGGMTLHAWSGIGVRDHVGPQEIDEIIAKEHVVRRITKAHVLIIDEVSMLSAAVLDAAERVIRAARRSDKPFGGMQIVLVGDFFQLPPVSRGDAPVFAYAARAWREANPIPLYLTEQHRHEDPELAEILSRIRSGEYEMDDISRILSREADPDDAYEALPRLYTHNADVDRENELRLNELEETPKSYLMDTFGREPLVEALKRGCLSPECLVLKRGAVVMATKNNPVAGYANGTLGTVVEFERATGYPVIETTKGERLTIAPSEWAIEEQGKVRAKITQIPLRLAWALTVHKSQGQSIDAAVIDLSRAFEYGQGYVALSRLRTLSGLYLRGFREEALKVHPEVKEKDKEFRALSREASRVFGALQESGELEELTSRFISACGGSQEEQDEDVFTKKDTYEETFALLEEGMTIEEIAKKRSLTTGTVISHIEKLASRGVLSHTSLEPLVPRKVREGLPQIQKALGGSRFISLTPVFKKLKGKYSFEELRLARVLLQDS